MRLPFLFCLLFSFGSLIYGQDNSLGREIILEDLPLSLEAEEDALILERHQERQLKIKRELKNELKAIKAAKIETNEDLYYLQAEFQQSNIQQSLLNQEIQTLRARRKYLLQKISDLLLDNDEDEEDWEKAPVKESRILQGMNQELRLLDIRIAAKELAIPQQIDEMEEMQEHIEDVRELSEQLDDLEEKNQAILKQNP